MDKWVERLGDFVSPVEPDVVQLLRNAVRPVSGEFEFVFACGLPVNLPNLPWDFTQLAKCSKAHKTSEILRRRISVNGCSRKVHKDDVFPCTLDADVLPQYENLLPKQCGPSRFRTEPHESWEMMLGNADVYRNPKTETIYCRRVTTREFCIRIPKLVVVVESVNDEMVKSIMAEKSRISAVPTLENPAFRHLYDKALKNEEVDPLPASHVPRLPELQPMTGFTGENEIQRAIRKAKEKYQDRKSTVSKRSKSLKGPLPPPLTLTQEVKPMTGFTGETKAKEKSRNRETAVKERSKPVKRPLSPPLTRPLPTPAARPLPTPATRPLPTSAVTRPLPEPVKRLQGLPAMTEFIEETLINKALREAREKCQERKSTGSERSRPLKRPHSPPLTQPEEVQPMTGFAEETLIQKALREAKEKYQERNRKTTEERSEPQKRPLPSTILDNGDEGDEADADILNIYVDEEDIDFLMM